MGDILRNISVFVASCDMYQDVWKPFFTFFFKYWDDCPFPIYLCANEVEYSHPKVKTILAGKYISWATDCIKCLRKIKTKYIIFLQEDFLLQKPVNTKRLLELVSYTEKRKAACLRLYPSPPPNKVCEDNPEIGEINKGALYRVSLQAAIWNRKIFLSLLRDGESPWDMEYYGSLRSNSLSSPFLSVLKGERVIDYFSTAVVQGEWVRRAVKICEREGILIDKNRRKVESWFRQAKRELLDPFVINKCKKLVKIIIGGKKREYKNVI